MSDQNKRSDDVSTITKESTRNFIRYLIHSKKCTKINCSRACCKMKKRITHVNSCTLKLRGGCSICTYSFVMCYYHAKQCKRVTCDVPNCKSLKKPIQDALLRVRMASLEVQY